MTAATVPVSSPRSHRRWWFVIVPVLLLIGLIAGYESFKEQIWPKRFGVVEPGMVYRSGQISPRLIRSTLAEHHVKTVIDLQGYEDAPIRSAELAATKDLGIEYHRYPLAGNGTGQISHYADALQTLAESRKAGKPVLVHCAAGTQRTGVAIAYFRLLIQKWPPDKTYAELGEYDWTPSHGHEAVDYLNQHMGELSEMLVARGVIERVPDPLPLLPTPWNTK